MERIRAIALVLLFVAGTGVVVADEQRAVVSAEYAVPLNGLAFEGAQTPPGAIDTLSLSLGYQFWRIFYGSVHLYNEIIHGADNSIGIGVKPVGLFSAGIGLEIPIAGPYLILDWQRLFTIPSVPHGGVGRYGGVLKIGLGFELLESWRLHVFSRSVNVFSDDPEGTVDYGAPPFERRTRFGSIGLGTSLRF